MSWDEITNQNTEHLSSSQLTMYQRCPLQYKFRYVDGKKKAPDGPLVVGISVHTSIEHNYSSKFVKSEPAKEDEVMDAYSKKFETIKGDAEFEEPVGQYKDQGYAMAKKHYKEVAPTVQPVEKPEFEFAITIPGVKRRFIGFIDVIGHMLLDAPRRALIDNKTTRRKFNQFEAGVSAQLTAYAYVYRKLFPKKPIDHVGLDVLVSLKNGVEKQRLLSERDPAQLQRFEHSAQHIEKAIDSGIFYPTDNPTHCSWCGYADICHAKAKVLQLSDRELRAKK